jgi:Geobacter CxxxxCH...CXXCH motif (GSu_C4xC__C2xCH)
MNTCRLYLPARIVLSLIGAVSIMGIASCGNQTVTPQGSTPSNTILAKGADVNTLPRHGKLAAAEVPSKAVFGMIWVNTAEKREYIFDGANWVPHDQSVDEFYQTRLKVKSTPKTAALVAADVCVDGDPFCTPTGAHGKHGAFSCKVCHKFGGRLVFAKTGTDARAYGAGLGTPAFDATAKTCSNVACHAVPSGTFSYYFMDGSGEAVLNTVNYGSASRPTPAWYATGTAGCTACHDDPPRNGSTGSNVWHSGYHGGQGPTGASNQCQFCHPDASSPNNGIGDTITNATLHANGAVTVQATFKSACFGCH